MVKLARERQRGLSQIGVVEDLRREPPDLAHFGFAETGADFSAPDFFPRMLASSRSISDGAMRSFAAAIRRFVPSGAASRANQETATLASTTISLTGRDLP
jgi:hypothetical protein